MRLEEIITQLSALPNVPVLQAELEQWRENRCYMARKQHIARQLETATKNLENPDTPIEQIRFWQGLRTALRVCLVSDSWFDVVSPEDLEDRYEEEVNEDTLNYKMVKQLVEEIDNGSQ